MPITAPYNFVPLYKKAYTVDWGDQISMDIPFADGEDGTITLKITNHSPLFVGNKKEDDESKSPLSRHIDMPDGSKRFYIPGTTLKGCFRSVMEILSFAQLEQYNDDYFGFRDFNTKVSKEYPNKIKNAKRCGWLFKEEDSNKTSYFIRPCISNIQPIKVKGKGREFFNKHFPNFINEESPDSAQKKQKSLAFNDGGELYPIITVESDMLHYKMAGQEKTVPRGDYRVVCTGYMEGKGIEYLFSENQEKPIEVSPEVFKKFDTVHKNTPYYGGKNGKGGFLKKRLDDGDPIPVFFEEDERTHQVLTMGITAKYRYPYQFSVKDMVEHAQAKLAEGYIDLPHAIFGHIGEGNSLRGRVLFGNAFADNTNIQPMQTVSGVLGQPRASYYPLYLQQNKKELQRYSSEFATIAGRKRYRITKGLTEIPLQQGNGNENIMSHLTPLPPNNTFTCKIRVHNLRKLEIGALLSAITFNQTEGTYHNIGMAKSFGYGIITCQVEEMEGFQHSIDDYLKEFNSEISYFLQSNGSSLSSEACLKQLVSIASATHTAEEMQEMDFDTCKLYKNNDNKSSLVENERNINILVNEDEVKEFHRLKLVNDKSTPALSGASALVEEGKWEQAIDLLRQLKIDLAGLADAAQMDEIENLITQYTTGLKAAEAAQQAADLENRFVQLLQEADSLSQEAQFEQALARVIQAKSLLPNDSRLADVEQRIRQAKQASSSQSGIAAELEKKLANGDYAVKDFKVCAKKVDKWLKDSGNSAIPDDQIEAFKATLIRLANMPKPDKGWASLDSPIWKTISGWISAEKAQQLFNDIKE